jgi:arylformamidase
MIYDITRRVTVNTAVFPGDTPYHPDLKLRMAAGASVNLVTVTTTLHIGTHVDAYFHYTPDGAFIDAMPLEAYIGRAHVVTTTRHDGALALEDLPPLPPRVERLLIHSPISDLPDSIFPETFPYPGAALIAALALRGCRLIGVDSPSMDRADSADLPGHNAIRQHGMVNIENLMLTDVPDGEYELIALPLRLADACASPVRAVLRTLI